MWAYFFVTRLTGELGLDGLALGSKPILIPLTQELKSLNWNQRTKIVQMKIEGPKLHNHEGGKIGWARRANMPNLPFLAGWGWGPQPTNPFGPPRLTCQPNEPTAGRDGLARQLIIFFPIFKNIVKRFFLIFYFIFWAGFGRPTYQSTGLPTDL